MEPYSRIGLIMCSYSFVRVALSPPHSVLVRALNMLVRFVALVVMLSMWCLNVKCWSKVMPRKVAVFWNGIVWLCSVSGVICVVSYLPNAIHCVFCGEISRLSGMSWLCMVLIVFCRSARAFCACL